MLAKYIDERFQRWMIFGHHKDTGQPSVCGSSMEVGFFEKAQAELIISERDQVLDMLTALAQRLDEVDPVAFNEIWYGIKKGVKK